MKKKSIVFFLFFYSQLSPIFAAPPAGAVTEYYKSNRLGMEISEIKKIRTDEFDYYLKKITWPKGSIEGGGWKSVTSLFENNTQTVKTEKIYSTDDSILKETIEEEDIVTERVFDDNALVMEEIIRETEKPAVKKVYIYDQSSAVESEEEYKFDDKDSKWILNNTVVYVRDSKGRILSVERTVSASSDKQQHLSRYRFAGETLLEEWHGTDNKTGSFIMYNTAGKVSIIMKMEDGKSVSEKKFLHNEDDSFSFEEITGENEKITSLTDNSGNIIEERSFIDNKEVSRTFNTYEEKKIVKRVTTTESGTERTLFFYDDDTLTEEKYYFNGELIKEINYIDENNKWEEFYFGGKKHLRIYYENDKKVKTETW